MQYTNFTGIPLVLAVWLASDGGYDLTPRHKQVSVTSLMKPIRSIILEQRIQAEQKSIDIAELVQAKLGTAVHQAVEDAWQDHHKQALKALGVPDSVIERIRVNPAPEELSDNIIPIYMENRTNKKVGDWWISGKYDAIVEGAVEDIKTTKTFNWIKGSNDEKYRIQASCYRYLNPGLITQDHANILMVFTDWSPIKAQADKNYPQKRVISKKIELMSIEETEQWIIGRLNLLDQYIDVPEEQLPHCTPEELWMDPPKWAYYKDSTQLARATKLYDNAAEANAAKAKNGTGLVVKRDMEPKFCKYCSAAPICTQAQGYIQQGILQI